MPSYFRTAVVLLLAVAIFSPSALGVEVAEGDPIAHHFNARSYGGHVESRQAALSAEGLLYLANSSGLFEFDGLDWRRIDSESLLDLFGVGRGPDGRIYVGRFEDFGYLEADSAGQFQYVSLAPFFGETKGQIFRRIGSDGERVFASTASQAFLWHPETRRMEIADGLDFTSRVFGLGGEVYVTGQETPLRRWREGAWEKVEEASHLRGRNGMIRAVATRGRQAYLVTAMAGVYRFDGERLSRLEADGEFAASWKNVLCALALEGGQLAVGTSLQGLYLLDGDGSIRRRYGREDGLSDEMARDLAVDPQGGLWLVQSKGVTRLQVPSPLSLYSAKHGITGTANDFEEHGGRLYVATSSGVYRSTPPSAAETRQAFEAVVSVGDCKSLLDTGSELLIGTSNGLYRLKGDAVSAIDETLDASYMLPLRRESDTILAAGYFGISILRRSGDGWVVGGAIEGMEGKPTHGLVESDDGWIWIKSGLGLARRFRFTGPASEVETFGTEDGLLKSWISPLLAGDQILLTTGQGILLKHDEESGRFREAEGYQYFPGEPPHVYQEWIRDPEGRDWVSVNTGDGRLIPKPRANPILGMQHLSSMADVRATAVRSVGAESLWIGLHDGLVRYRLDSQWPEIETHLTCLRSARSLPSGEVLYAGAGAVPSSGIELQPSENSMRIKVGGSSFLDRHRLEYRIFLDGFEEVYQWYSGSNYREYTNIPPGRYTLRAASRDALGRESEMEPVPVRVRSPWHQTSLAYLLYLAAAAGLVYAGYRWRLRRLNRTNAELARQVKERTSEIERQAAALARQNEALEIKNRELAELAKKAEEAAGAQSRFLAMMSHEIRTPMNGVMGMCALLDETRLEGDQQEFVNSIRSSSETLMNVINDILDYTRFEEGRIELEEIEYDVAQCAEDVCALLGPQALEKNLELRLFIDGRVDRMRMGDPTRIKQVLVNLVGNAIKFTESGRVDLTLSCSDGEWLCASVEDTGMGIAEEKRELIFKPFSQAEVSNVRRFGGTGLGLAICRNIADCMGGSISLQSELGRGSRFDFRFPSPVAEEASAPWDCAGLMGKKALAYCDEEGTRELIGHYFDLWGIEATHQSASSLFAAGEVASGRTDFVVIEHKLQHFDGIEMASRFLRPKKAKDAVPVVLLVSKKTEYIKQREGEWERLRVLVKPIIPSRFLRTVRSLFEEEPALARAGDAAGKPEAAARSTSEIRALVVEDNPINQQVALHFLEGLGVQADLAINGKLAVEAQRRNGYDIIFMDIQMPELDGVEATKEILTGLRDERQPLIYGVSAGVMAAERDRCLAAGMAGFIRKPIMVDDLRRVIEEFESRRRAPFGSSS